MKITIKILLCDKHAPVGKLADAEVHFEGGELDELKLVGFAVWMRRDGNGCNVTFPSRQFMVHGDRRSFALLRSVGNPNSQNAIREAILQAYADCEREPDRLAS
jgi:hypothetical protein